MTNPLLQKYEELYGKKEEPKVPFELTPEFKEAIDKQKEDRIRYLASLPKDTLSVVNGPTGYGITATNYINANNASISYKPRPVTTHDIDSCKQSYLQVAEMLKKGYAKVLNMTMERGWDNGYNLPMTKMTFEVVIDD